MPDDAIATAAARFGEEMRSGGGVVFNVKWNIIIVSGSLGSMYDDYATCIALSTNGTVTKIDKTN